MSKINTGLALLITATMFGQTSAQESVDINGDGIGEMIAPDLCGQGWDVTNGANNQILLNLTGVDQQEMFHAFASFTPDLNMDGTADIVVFAPAAATANELVVGRVYVFSGSNGDILWILDGNDTHRVFPGFATIPDQTSDGVSDILFRATSQTDIATDWTLVVDGQNGSLLRTLRGAMPEYAYLARNGERLYASTDIDNSDIVDVADAAALSAAATAQDPAGDVNNDGDIDLPLKICTSLSEGFWGKDTRGVLDETQTTQYKRGDPQVA